MVILPPIELNLREYREHLQQPCAVFPRTSASDVWLIAATPLDQDAVRWVHVKSGQDVFVPAFGYRLRPVPEAIFGAGVQLAIQAMAGLPAGSIVRQLQLVIGRPAEDLRPEEDCFRVTLGFAVQLA